MAEDVVSQGSATSQDSGSTQAQEPSGQSFGESQAGSEQQDSESSKPKGKGRYERTKQWRDDLREREAKLATGPKEKAKSPYALARERRLALEAREAQVAQQQQALAQQQEQARRPRRNYSLADLRRWRDSWAQDAENEQAWNPESARDKAELVRKADLEIQNLEAEERQHSGHQQFIAQWMQAEALLKKEDPDFHKDGSALDQRIKEILAGPQGEQYRRYALGIIAVYDRAKKELLEAENDGLRTKAQKFETENKRLSGLTSLGGGSPGQMGNGSSTYTPEQFAKLTAKQMKEHLLRSR